MAPPGLDVMGHSRAGSDGTLQGWICLGHSPGSPSPAPGLSRAQASAQSLPRMPKESLECSRFCTIPAPSSWRERVGRSLSPEQIQLMNTGENQRGWQQVLDEEGRKGC